MIYVTDTSPAYCPNCGKALTVQTDRICMQDWMAGASFTCDCGARFQRASRQNILEIAPDIRYYEQRINGK